MRESIAANNLFSLIEKFNNPNYHSLLLHNMTSNTGPRDLKGYLPQV